MNTRTNIQFNVSCSKSETFPFINCWHFCIAGTPGASANEDDEQYLNNIRTVCVISNEFRVTVVAYSLCSTGLHLILKGEQASCMFFISRLLEVSSVPANIGGIACTWLPDEDAIKEDICRIVKLSRRDGMNRRSSEYEYFRRCRLNPSVTWGAKGKDGEKTHRPNTYLDVEFVERLFGSYLAFVYWLNKA